MRFLSMSEKRLFKNVSRAVKSIFGVPGGREEYFEKKISKNQNLKIFENQAQGSEKPKIFNILYTPRYVPQINREENLSRIIL